MDIEPDTTGIMVTCGEDIDVGCLLMYSYIASAGCTYHIYDADNTCIKEQVFEAVPGDYSCGGGFVVDDSMSCIIFSSNTALSKSTDLLISEVITGVDSVTALIERLKTYKVKEQDYQDIINLYLDANGGSGGGNFQHRWEGSTLIITSDSGTSSYDLLGPQGPKGDTGDTGPSMSTEELLTILCEFVGLYNRPDGSGASFGKYAEEDGLLDVDWDIRGRKNLYLDGGLITANPIAPRNLLDNSDFTNPVNQRGQTTYQFDSGYTIDRWKLHWTGDGSLTINDGYITLTRPVHAAYLFQSIPLEKRLIGKTVTFAARVRGNGHMGYCFNDGGVRELVEFNSSDWTVVVKTIVVPTYDYTSTTLNGVEICTRLNCTVDVEWVALYEGEYTAETLPHYIPKGYEVELLICRQYDHVTGEYVGLRNFATPRNLLDNSDFTNPVNQRGATSYTGSGYTIDRWRAFHSDTTHEIVDGGVTVSSTASNPNIYQALNLDEVDTTKTMTAAACDIDGNVYIWTGIPTETTTTPVCVYISGNRVLFRLVRATTWQWAALYEGEYTAETLPADVPKGYGTELLECQRYYVPISYQWLTGFSITGNNFAVEISLPCEMRQTPTAMFASDFGYYRSSGWSALTFMGMRHLVGGTYAVMCSSISDGDGLYIVRGISALSADL